MTEIILRSEKERTIAVDLVQKVDLAKPRRFTLIAFVPRRSLSSNGLLHKWFQNIADEIGDDAESVKDTLKGMFAPKVEHTNKITGEVSMQPMRTRDMDQQQMSAFMTRIMAFAAGEGWFLTHPDDLHDYRR